ISHHLQKWASDCNDWLGIQSFMTLAKQNDLLPHEALMARLGLYREGKRWYMSPDARGLCRNNLPNWLDRIVPLGMTGVPSEMHVLHLFLCWLFTKVIGTCIENCLHIQP